MRVLMVHNHYQVRGGEDESFAAESRLLERHGHVVHTLTEHNDRVAELGRVKTAVGTVWSRSSHRAVRQAIREHRPDVLHVQNFFPLLSPSIYYAARAEGVPIVQSLRNYRLFCLNALFYRDGHVCEDCLGRAVPWPGVKHRCYHESVAGSVTVGAMISTHRALGTWQRLPALYVALTDFARRKFVEGGLPSDKIAVKPNFVESDPGPGDHAGGFALFVGRLSAEKGVQTLLRAWERAGPRPRLRLVGDGPLASAVASAAQRNDAIEFLGRRALPEVYTLMGEASMVVFPTECYETFGRTAIEAFAKGTPVIAADIGAVASVVDHGRTGLRFPPGDAEALADRVAWVHEHPAEWAEMGREARREYEANYTAEQNYQQLVQLYQRAIARASKK